jgi:NDP-sugar pyrophosphorylase family protein
MNIIIPCGGLGERFLREGYVDPKPLIPAMGKPILFWLLDELHIRPEDLIIIAYNTDLERWRMEVDYAKFLAPGV